MIAALLLPALNDPANNQFFLLCDSAHNKKNWLFAGSQRAGRRAAVAMSLIQSAKMNGLDPYGYNKDVLERLPSRTCKIHFSKFQ